MIIKLVVHNIRYEYEPDIKKEQLYEIAITPDTTIQQLLEAADTPISDLSEYYYLSGVHTFNTNALPYIISSDTVYWNALYEDTKVVDFLSTHNIGNNTITVKTGFVQAGGPGFISLAEIWSAIYPVIDQFVTVIGFGAIAGGAGKWIHSLFKGKVNECPQANFDIIFAKKEWNHNELAQLLAIDSDDAKQLLKAFGYIYSVRKMLYIQQEKSLALREKLSKTNVLDI